jgi:hypothetical protein
MAGETAVGVLDQNPEIGMGPLDVTPRQPVEDLARPDFLQERLGQWPGLVAVQNVYFNAHCLDFSAFDFALPANVIPNCGV